MPITSDDATSEIEEERRLAYVGITRVKEHLTITSARMRMVRGETQFNKVSRFVKEIPRELMAGEVYEPKRRDDDLERNSQSSTERLRRPSKRHLHTARSMNHLYYTAHKDTCLHTCEQIRSHLPVQIPPEDFHKVGDRYHTSSLA